MFYVAFEGIDGCGKSTLAKAVTEKLLQAQIDVQRVWEPGSTPIGEAMRTLVKTTAGAEEIAPISELLMFNVARHQSLNNVVMPALAAGKVVISDRCYLSSRAYQGYGRHMLQQTNALEQMIPDAQRPNLIIYLDVEVETGIRRAEERDETDRIEQEPTSFFRRVRDGYRTAAKMEPERVVRINANRSVEEVFATVWSIIAPRCGLAVA